MATQDQKGWIWTQEEKQWIKTWKRKVGIVYRRLSEQVDRFQTAVPMFAEEAATTALPFLTGAERLLTLANGAPRRKYQALSPEEAKQQLSEVDAYLEAWSAFTRRSDVQAAIGDANRRIDAQKRAQQKQRRAARAQMEQQFKSPEFAQVLDGYVDLVFQETAKFVALVQGLPFLGPVGSEADRSLLRRLMVIHFIRACTLSNVPVCQAVEQFVHRQPTPTVTAVVRHTISMVIQDRCHYLLSTRSGYGPQMSVQEVLIGYLQGAFNWLLQSIEEWKEESRTMPSVSPSDFSIFGVDYSLAAQPESHPAETTALSAEAEDELYAKFMQDE